MESEQERERIDRLRRTPTNAIADRDCAYCQQLRGFRQRYQRSMAPCPMHGTTDQVTTRG